MEMSELFDPDLSNLEEQIASRLTQISPDRRFVEQLRGQLLGSRIFEYRRSIGAMLVASLSVILAGTLLYALGKLIRQALRGMRQG
jgi:hypothetical protein